MIFSQRFIKIGFFLTLFFISACSIKTKREPVKADQGSSKLFESAKVDLKSGRKKTGVRKLLQILRNSPNTDIADDAAILIGHTYFKKQGYKKALSFYLRVVNSEFKSPRLAEAQFFAGRCHFFLDQWNQSIELLEQTLSNETIAHNLRYRSLELLYKVYLQQKQPRKALKSLNDLLSLSIPFSKKSAFQLEVQRILESEMNWKEIKSVSNDSDFSQIHGYAYYLLAKNYADLREFDQAVSYYENVLQLLPGTEYSEEASHFLKLMEARKIVEPRTIGVVLPLSGRSSKVAYMVLRGIQLALGIFDDPRSPYRLAIVDSEGDPDIAKRAVEKLVVEDHVIAIIGSLLSKTSEAISQTAHSFGVPSIALSQKLNLTSIGNSVFRNGITSEMLVSHLVSNAMDKMGMRNFAILYPNDPYGVEYANLFWDHVLARGGSITGVQPYTPNETDFKGPVRRLVGTFYVEDRMEEYRYRVKEWQEKNLKRISRNSPPEDLLPPVVDFEAIFIPDGTRALAQIAPMLRYNDVSQVPLLGTNLWNSQSLVSRVGKLAENTFFVDSLSLSPSQLKQTLFYQHFLGTFEQGPNSFEIRAYDSANVLRSILESGSVTREAVIERLQQIRNFPGIAGPLSITAQREVSQPLSFFTVKDGSISESYTTTK